MDIIIEYQYKNGKIDTVPIRNSFMQKNYLKSPDILLINVLKNYIGVNEDLKIIKIYEYKKQYYKITDFRIKIIQKDENKLENLIFVNILNKVTGVTLEDWVDLNQIRSSFLINNLICWEKDGKEIKF